MPRKGTKKLWSFLDPLDPRGLVVLMNAYLESRALKNWAAKSIIQAEQTLSAFIVWCQDRAVTKAADVTRPILERYQRHLYTQTHGDGRPLSMRTQNVRLYHVRLWFSWLARNNYVLANPAADLELASCRGKSRSTC